MTLHGCTKSLKVMGFKATLATNCWVLRKLLVRPLARRMSIILTGPGINEQGVELGIPACDQRGFPEKGYDGWKFPGQSFEAKRLGALRAETHILQPKDCMVEISSSVLACLQQEHECWQHTCCVMLSNNVTQNSNLRTHTGLKWIEMAHPSHPFCGKDYWDLYTFFILFCYPSSHSSLPKLRSAVHRLLKMVRSSAASSLVKPSHRLKYSIKSRYLTPQKESKRGTCQLGLPSDPSAEKLRNFRKKWKKPGPIESNPCQSSPIIVANLRCPTKTICHIE